MDFKTTSFLKPFFLVQILLQIFQNCESSNMSPKILDLSYVYDKNTPTFPVHTKFSLKNLKKERNKLGYWIEYNEFSTGEHAGTHMDAPVHFIKDAQTLDQIELFNLYRIPGVMIDLKHIIEENNDNKNYEIRPEHIEKWVSKNGEIPDGSIVLFRTGYGDFSDDISKYAGKDSNGKYNFPGLGEAAAKWIVGYKNASGGSKGILGIGLDSISFDVGKSDRFPAHVILLGAGLFGLENMANLHLLPPRDFTLTLLPIKIGGGSGGPTRVLAEIGGTPYSEAYYSAGPAAVNRKENSILLMIFVITHLLLSKCNLS